MSRTKILLAVAAALTIASRALSDTFLLAPTALWFKLLLNAIAAIGALSMFLILQRAYRAKPVDPLERSDNYRQTGVNALLSLIAFWILNLFLLGMVPLLHRLAGPRPATVVEQAWVGESTGRGCRRMVLLSGDSTLMRRRLCGISESQYRPFQRYGRIEIAGTASRLGIDVRSYRAVPAESVDSAPAQNP